MLRRSTSQVWVGSVGIDPFSRIPHVNQTMSTRSAALTSVALTDECPAREGRDRRNSDETTCAVEACGSDHQPPQRIAMGDMDELRMRNDKRVGAYCLHLRI